VSPLTAFAGGLVVGFFGIGPDATAAAVVLARRGNESEGISTALLNGLSLN
jgi:hypothetical protein